MAKLNKKYSFSKGVLSQNENGDFIHTEITKDDSVDYNITTILTEFLGTEEFTISFGADDTVPTADE